MRILPEAGRIESTTGELILINRARDGWVVSWNHSFTLLYENDPKLVKLILTHLDKEEITEATFCQEILDLDERIISALVAKELAGAKMK